MTAREWDNDALVAYNAELLDQTHRFRSQTDAYADRAEKAEAKIARVEGVHRPDPRHNGALCEDDDQPWPCRTIRALWGDQPDCSYPDCDCPGGKVCAL
jgi:hypothetical protein